MAMNNPEDTKLVTLATNSLARSGAPQAAPLRDKSGHTHI